MQEKKSMYSNFKQQQQKINNFACIKSFELCLHDWMMIMIYTCSCS